MLNEVNTPVPISSVSHSLGCGGCRVVSYDIIVQDSIPATSKLFRANRLFYNLFGVSTLCLRIVNKVTLDIFPQQS